MWIKELNLIGFGKFKNKVIGLKEGFNVIYGENESGKSTLHSFIDGMFYGFLRPNVRSALYRDELDKYDPWDKSRYAGVIRFFHEGKPYGIERDFARDKANTIVIDETTGADITKEIDLGPVRVYQPGIHFFDFNTRVFNNTISIKQISSITEAELANEVTEKLVNITTSQDDNISVKKAVSELEAKKQAIGTENAHTKPYARNIKAIRDLESEKERILSDKEKHDESLEEKIRLNDLLEEEKEKLSNLKEQLSMVETLDKKETLKESIEIKEKIDDLKEKIEKLEKFSSLSKEEYNEATGLNQDLKILNRDIENDEKELIKTNDKLLEYSQESEDGSNNDKLDEIIDDYHLYEELEEKKKHIESNKNDNILNFLERDLESFISKNKIYKTIQVISIILLVIIGLVIFSKQYPMTSILLPIPILIAGYLANKSKKIKKEIDKTGSKIDEINKKEEADNVEIQEIETTLLKILGKYKMESKIEFKRLYKDNEFKSYGLVANIKAQKDLERLKESISIKIKENYAEKEEKSTKLKEILQKNNLNSIEEFSLGLDNKVLYDKYTNELASSKELLNKVLGEYTIESLAKDLEGLVIDQGLEDLNKNQINEEIKNTETIISALALELREAEINVTQYGENLHRLIEIDEETTRKITLKKELEDQIASIDLAVQTIEVLSKDIHSEFAPSINQTLSEIVEKITSGKYNSVKIDRSLDISIENPETSETIKVEDLSGGTIDQLYFALRFGIINSMISKDLPLILDDCFVQYDENRLRNTLDFLKENCDERQIIFFTCHKREIELLNSLGVDYNLINLS